MKIAALSLCAILFLSACTGEGHRIDTYTGSGIYYPGEQYSAAPARIEMLPDPIPANTKEYLKAWLGESIYSEFKYSGGKVVGKKLMDSTAQADSTIPDYVLDFTIKNLERGLKGYTLGVPVRKDGKILGEPDFPNTAKYPERANIISMDEALSIVEEKMKDDQKIEYIKLEYDREKMIIIWNTLLVPRKRQTQSSSTGIFIDAHSGKVIKQEESPYFYFSF
jgi:hypothetical protein